MKPLENFLNNITMYRLVLYVLIFYLVIAILFTFFGILPFSGMDLFYSSAVFIMICWITNRIFAKLFNAPTNLESVYITALILSLIVTPINSLSGLLYIIVIGVFAISSKYIIAFRKKHIFNPAAVALVLSFFIFKFGGSWWIGNQYMLAPILIGGLLIVKKIKRFSLVLSFFIIYLIILVGQSLLLGNGIQFLPSLLDSSIFFFTFIMLTEPQTTPTTKINQIIFGGLIGVTCVFLSFEIALVLGNIFAYIVSPKGKLILKLKEKIKIAPDAYDFIFNLDKPFNYHAGQYMEWTNTQKAPDSRGSRRYFTLASSPTEGNLRIGVKTYPNGSSFKNTLVNMKIGDQIVASQLSGEFILPEDNTRKLVFIAGGIGITPFRSIIKYLLEKNEKRDIVLLYSNKTQSDIVYKNLFNEASNKIGIKVLFINTDTMGYIDEKLIREKVPDFKERIFYISGPHSMVDIFEKTLRFMGVKSIKTDFFSGYA